MRPIATSSGCETRSGSGEPAQAGSEPRGVPGFQTLIRNPLAPAGAAYSDPALVEIVAG